jgi:hypothetical protein
VHEIQLAAERLYRETKSHAALRELEQARCGCARVLANVTRVEVVLD